MAGHFTFPAAFATVRPPLWAPLSTVSIPFEATCFTFAGALPAEVERGRVERERVPLERARPFEERGRLLDRLPLVERDLDVLDLDLLPVLDLDLLPVALWAIRTLLPHPCEIVVVLHYPDLQGRIGPGTPHRRSAHPRPRS